MKRRPAPRLWTALLLPLLAATITGCASKPDPYRQRVDALAAPYIDSGHIVGMSVGFIVDGEQYTYHFGSTHADKDNKPDDRTLYEIGSISKTFTGLMLARGSLEGHWQLDDPAADYLPDHLADDIELPAGVTLRRLSTHTSGLPRMPHDFAPADATNPYVDYDGAKLYETLSTISLESEPGTSASYSNLAVGLLGQAMATEYGMSYEQLLRHWVLRPLDMRSTTISLTDKQASRLAGPHNGAGEPDHRWDFDALAGAGAIRSDLGDMLRYARAQLDPDSTPIADAIKLGQQRHTDPDGPSLGNGTGLGWVFLGDLEDGTGDGQVLGHNGQTGGFHSFIGIDKASDIAIVVLTNTSNDYGSRFSADLRKLLMGEEVQPAEIEPLPEVFPVEDATLERYVGHYQLAPEMVFTITAEDGKLYAHLTGQPTLRVYPTSETEFDYRVVEARLVFELPEGDGPSPKLTLFQNGMEMVSPRITEDGGQ